MLEVFGGGQPVKERGLVLDGQAQRIAELVVVIGVIFDGMLEGLVLGPIELLVLLFTDSKTFLLVLGLEMIPRVVHVVVVKWVLVLGGLGII